jgi:hypothetical protein
MNKHSLLNRAVATAALAVALAGLGTGVAEAKPMERDHKRYCTKVIQDYNFTRKAYLHAHQTYGPEDRLTIQAASNYERANDVYATSGC